MKSPQQILNDTARHCFYQNEQALDGRNCLYLDSETKFTCAVGCHLSPAALDLVVDIVADFGTLVDILKEEKNANVSNDLELLEANRKFFIELQAVHDNESNWNNSKTMQQAFNEVAATFNLIPLDETYRFVDR